MAITYDAATANQQNTGSSLTVSHTAGVASDMVAVAYVCVYDIFGADVTAVTYGGSAMTQIDSSAQTVSGTLRAYVYWLGGVSGGANDLVVTLSGSNDNCSAGVITLNGASQTGPTNTDIVAGNTSASAIGDSMTTLTDDSWIVDGLMLGGLDNTEVTDTGAQVQRWFADPTNHHSSGWTRTTGTAGAYSRSWSFSPNAAGFILIGTEIEPAGAAPAPTVQSPIMLGDAF